MRRAWPLALAGALLAACSGQPNRAPVEERGGRVVAAATGRAAPGMYTVARGDTLYAIAWRFGLDHLRLARANRIAPPYTIYPGQRLLLGERAGPAGKPRAPAQPASAAPARPAPGGGAPEPAAGPGSGGQWASPGPRPAPATGPAGKPRARAPAQPTLAAPARPAPGGGAPQPAAGPGSGGQWVSPGPRPAPGSGAPPAATAIAGVGAPPAASASRGLVEGAVEWRWPASGRVVRRFSGETHKGIDIGGEAGDPVRAAAPGRVVYAGSGIGGYGNLLIVKHNDTYLSAYGHNRRLLVGEGTVLAQGQRIAEKGDSATNSVKLHFEIRREGKPVDPLRLLPRRR